MNITLVINSLGIGGAEKVLISLANHLASTGHKINFITFCQQPKNYYEINNNNINLINLSQYISYSDLTYKSKFNLFFKFVRIIKTIYFLRKIFKLLQPDLIISFLVGANLFTLLANIKLNLPIIVSERTDPFIHNISNIHKKLRLLLYKYSNFVVVQNNYIATYFKNISKEKIIIIPNFIKQPKILKSSIKKINNILSIGRLDKDKDHKTLIYAFAALAKCYPDLTLFIYGEGELRSFLEKLILELNLVNRVFLPGIAMNIEEKLINADLFVFPSVLEGFSNALGEAMSHGLPVIAANCHGNSSLIQNEVNGLLFECNNVNELTCCMEKLLNNIDYCNKLATKAKDIVKQFPQNGILKKWSDVIETISRQ